ncbi:MAG: hypothetical protein HW421_662 [Ignavibacteria bacterium]|nr:hypothetical protein [Ignavibacteria bacterium]
MNRLNINMKKFYFKTMLFLFILTPAYSQPKLVIVGGDTHDWGKVSGANPLKQEIKITNQGDKKLIITEVKPGCGCTSAPLDKKELEFGDTATMSVQLNVGASSGDITKSITISSNDPQSDGKHFLWLKANIYNAIDIQPMRLLFNQMEIGQKSTSSSKIINNSKSVVKLTGVDVRPYQIFTINLKGDESIKPGESLELTGTVIPKITGPFSGNIKFKTDNKDYPEISIEAWGVVNAAKSQAQNK